MLKVSGNNTADKEGRNSEQEKSAQHRMRQENSIPGRRNTRCKNLGGELYVLQNVPETLVSKLV